MIELEQEVWHEFVYDFTNRLSANYNVEESLKMFVEDYWSVLDNLASQACEDDDAKYKPNYDADKDFATKKYLEEKNNIIWNYVYDLKREISNLKKDVALLKDSNISKQSYGPIKYPNNIPPTHEYPLDWYKITANSNVPLSGKVTDAQYTPEQIEEWSKVRYTKQ